MWAVGIGFWISRHFPLCGTCSCKKVSRDENETAVSLCDEVLDVEMDED